MCGFFHKIGLELLYSFYTSFAIYRGKNDEHKFLVNGGGYIFEVRCRPRTWQKLLQAQQDYPAWTAAITGQLGERIKQGFRLMNASVQIYESKVKSPPST